jgi:thioester reductase-like protein
VTSRDHDAGEVGLEIAIIGMACRFPGADSVDVFWRNLRTGIESIRYFRDDELEAAGVAEEIRRHPSFVPAFGALERIDCFDAPFFGIPPREAARMDPQHRIFLECAWHALEDAGYDPERYSGLIGVFAGSGLSTYLLEHLYRGQPILGSEDGFHLLLGNDKEFMVTRTAYKLDLRGPACAIQTACSTSLVAVHAACQSLLSGETDIALAGGVSILLPQDHGYVYQEDSIASPDGHCRAYDARAKGTVVGNGAGLVVLKRLQDASDDGDSIRAVIKGSAINNDGGKKMSYTAPRTAGQAAVIRAALSHAGISSDTVSYVEGHGTGTPIGDPIEVAALTEAFRSGSQRRQYCALGSVKTNIGHLNSAAGVAGLIKATLALQHRELPPSLHFDSPNPTIDFASTPFFVNSSLREWGAGATPRRAGISSFGIGGTNAHVVLEEAPRVAPAPVENAAQLVVLSARSSEACEEMATSLRESLVDRRDCTLADVAYTLQVGRRAFAHRLAVVADSLEEAATALAERDRRMRGEVRRNAPPISFIIPGQGSQYTRMGEGLYRRFPVFRATVDRCCERLRTTLDVDLRALLFPTRGDEAAADAKLANTVLTQPAIFVVAYALATLWAEVGVRPDALLGHSIGEIVAASLAGVFTLDDALDLVAARARLLASLPPGAMLAVPLAAEALDLPDDLGVAAINAPDASVISGPVRAVEDFAARLSAQNISTKRLHVSHAFHSPMVAAVMCDFEAAVRGVSRTAPTSRFISNVTGRWISAADATSPEYWASHLRNPVLFARGVETILDDMPATSVLELGPGKGLTSFIKRAQARRRGDGRWDVTVCVPSLRHSAEQVDDTEYWLRSLGALFCAGHKIDFASLHTDARVRRVPLPGYRFERRRYWVERICHHGARTPTEHRATAIPACERPAAASTVELPRTEFERTLVAIWGELLGFERIGIHDDFFELGGQSLLAAELMSRIASSTGERLRVQHLYDAPTVAKLAALIESGPTLDARQPDLRTALLADIALASEIEPRRASRSSGRAETILVTGATGFLGAFVTRELLERTQAHVLCLVRANDRASGKARLLANFQRYELALDGVDDRIDVVCGNVARPLLGIDEHTYGQLAERIEAVFHVGAHVHFAHPYSVLRETNVLGMQNMVRFAATHRLKPLHFASTLAIFSAPPYEQMPVVREDDPAAHGAKLHTGYQQTKWVGDRMLADAGARGLPITIHRPATVGGHSVTGAWNRADYVLNMLIACVATGLAPDIDYFLHFAPVDDVAGAIVALSNDPGCYGKAFHLVASEPVRLSAALNVIRMLGYDMKTVPYSTWRETLLARASSGPVDPLPAYAPLLPESPYLPALRVDNGNAVQGLAGTGIRFRPLDRSILKTYFERYHRDGLVERAPR